MSKAFGNKFEKAVRMICQHMPVAETLSKPTLFHGLRVAIYLYNNNYAEDIVIAGLMHDVLEDTEITEADLTSNFNQNVTDLVKANTKNKSLKDQGERIQELINRCAATSESALIVKAADILDNLNYYRSISDTDEIAYCQRNFDALKQALPETYQDPIFQALAKAFAQN